MYEDKTVESIKADILSRITSMETREGSFANDMAAGVALEIWKVYQAANSLIAIAFVDETSGPYIDKRAAEYGKYRKAGTKATAAMTLTGTDGTVVKKGKVFLTASGLQFETNADATISGGSASVTAVAASVGTGYNVGAGTISLQLYSQTGLDSWTSEAATGGTDPETDAALFTRLDDFRKNPATSGNAAHYKQWALETNGVGDAKVVPLADGPGTVKVLIVGYSNEPVESAVEDACKAIIASNQPIGASVDVVSASGLSINVAAAITVNGSTTKEDALTDFSTALVKYLKSISFSKYTLLYNRVANLLMDTPGVENYSLLAVNGNNVDIDIGADQVPVKGTVVFS